VNEIQRTRTIGYSCQPTKKKSAGTRYGHVVPTRFVVAPTRPRRLGGRATAYLAAIAHPV